MKILYLLLFSTLAISVNAQTTWTVTNTIDDGTTTTAGTLRNAIFSAMDGDTIRFDPSLINAGSDTITFNGEIAFSKALVIKGLYNSTDTLYFSGNNTNRHFNITNTGNVTLDSLVLINGYTSGNGGSVSFKESGTLFVKSSVIRGNNSDGTGGGIFSESLSSSTVTIENSTISGNTSNSSSSLGYGGGIYSNSNNLLSTVTIENSTISGNTSSSSSSLGYGGGIFSYSGYSSSIVSVRNSTISGNTAYQDGGGIHSESYSVSSIITIENSTISGNTATSGGGIYSYSPSSSTIDVTSSIIWTAGGASNISNNAVNPTFTSNGNNIFSDAPTGAIASDSVNVSSASLNLLPLAFNGGTTQTMLPGLGSIAIDAGNDMDVSDAQNRPIVGRRDRGAAEYFCTGNAVDTKTGCDSYTWINGETYTANNSTAEYTVYSTTSGVCDTTYTLDLTINNVDVTTTQNGVNLSANATGADYKWIDCNNNNDVISGETSQTFTATVNGNYAVIVTENGCTDTSACMVVNNVGLNDLMDITGISIFPNPAKDHVTVKIENMKVGNHTVELLDATGRVLSTQVMTEKATVLSLLKLESGIYMIRISNGNEQGVYSVIKE